VRYFVKDERIALIGSLFLPNVGKGVRDMFEYRAGRRPVFVSGLAVVVAGFMSATASAVSITAETTSCNGERGLATFESSSIFKIQAANCPDPENPEQKLQQVLLKSAGDLTRYELVTVTVAERDAIMDRLRRIDDAELDRLSRPDVVIEDRRTVPVTPAPAEQSSEAPEPAARPTIRMVDPPVLDTPRSSNRVITAPDTSTRQIVGNVEADAGLFSLTLNGARQTANADGLFSASVPIEEAQTPVKIVAVDNEGQSSTVEFVLVRKPPEAAPATADGENVYGNYHALIIANNGYQSLDDLVTPLNDATVIGGLLESNYGFQVQMLVDANRYEMLSALNDLRRDLTDEDNVLIYFAGHGAYDDVNHRGHWLPVDAELDSTANWVSTVEVTDIVNAMSARHVLVVADSCYSGTLARSANISLDPGMSEDLRGQWLRAIAQARSRHVLTSGGVKPVVDDGGTGHSIFANAFIEVLRDGSDVMESSVIFRRVKDQVGHHADALNLDQTPRYAQLKNTGHEFGEFLLVRQP
jgi:uncharacterized caspase-like protein